MNKHEARKDKVVEIKEVLRLADVYGVDAEWLGDFIILFGQERTIRFEILDENTARLA